jgi:hypothetical protein
MLAPVTSSLIFWLWGAGQAAKSAAAWYEGLPPEKQKMVRDMAWKLFKKALKDLVASEVDVLKEKLRDQLN